MNCLVIGIPDGSDRMRHAVLVCTNYILANPKLAPWTQVPCF